MNTIKPNLNVTPLIDVLLVLLIIFMVISPLRPSKFETRIPSEPQSNGDPKENSDTLVVKINTDSTLELNKERNMGSIEDPKNLQEKLTEVFGARTKNGLVNPTLSNNKNLSFVDTIQKTVFVKAPKKLSYGKVVKVIDAVKLSGANPISLQIDNID